MNKKTLVILAAVAAVLVALVLLRNQSDQPGNILEQVRLEPLVPAGLSTDAIARIELYAGAAPSERVVLTRSTQDAAEWTVASHFNAPVETQRIREFLANATGLRGEFRTTAETDEALEAFELTDDAAFHVVAYGDSGDTPFFHTLVGKSPEFRTVFVRQADNRSVYVEEIDLKRDAGVQQPFDALDASVITPKPNHWIRADLLALDTESVSRIEMTTPSRTVSFERQALPVPESAETDEDADTDATPPEPAFEWVVAEGGPGGPLKSIGMDGLVARFGGLRGETIVDPALAADYGMESPAYRLEMTLDGTDAPTAFEGGRPDPTGPGYLRVVGNPHIYEVQSFTFEAIFPRASQLFDLPAVDIPLSAVREVRTSGPEGTIHLIKGEDEEWGVASPSAPLPVQQTTVDELGRAAVVWRPVDYVNADAVTGLDTPLKSITVVRDDGSEVVTHIGNPSPEGGYFVGFDGAPMPLRMSQTDVDRLFPSPSDLFQLALLDLHPDLVDRVVIERAEDAFTLARTEEEGWTLSNDDGEAPADAMAVENLLGDASALQAREIAFELEEAPGEADTTVRFFLGDDSTSAVHFGPVDGAYRWAIVDGMAGVYRVPIADAARMLPDSSALQAEAAGEDS